MMHVGSVLVWTWFLAGFVQGAVGDPERRVLLAPKFEIGETLYVEWKWRGKDELHEEGSRSSLWEESYSEILGAWLTRLPDTAPDRIRLELVIDRRAATFDNPDEKTGFDSDVDDYHHEPNMLAGLLGPMIGGKVTVEIASDGEEVSVSGMGEIAKRATLPAKDHRLRAWAERRTDDDGWRFLWEQWLGLFAHRRVSVGGSWSRELERFGVFGFNYALKGIVREGHADIAAVTYGYSEVFPKNHDTDRKPRTWHRILSTGDGVAQIDLATGRLRSFKETGQNETVWIKAEKEPAGRDVVGRGTYSQGLWVVSKDDRLIEKRRLKARRSSRQTVK